MGRSDATSASRAGRWFYVGIAVVAIIVSIASFGPSIIDQSARRGPPTPLIKVHAAFMAAWLTVYLAQTCLAATKRLAAHRSLGAASLVLVAGIVVSGFLATAEMARRGYDLSGDLGRSPGGALSQTVFQFANLILFAAVVGTAVLLRGRPDTHKRLMTLAVIVTLMPAPLTHLIGRFNLPGALLSVWSLGVLIALIVHDRRTRGRIHPASLWGWVSLMAFGFFEAAIIAPSEMWRRVMAWLAR